jgi:predicted dehydrogenase
MVGQVAHLANYLDIADCRVVAMAELRPELRGMVAAKFGIKKSYESHHELLADGEVDAVVVVTRPQAHGPIVLDALRAGCHVLSEKPMAHTVEQGMRLVQAAQSKNLRYAVGFMKRHDAGAQHAKMMLEGLRQSGELGRIVLMRGWCFGGEFRCGMSDFVMTNEARPDGLATWPIAPDWIPTDCRADYASFVNVFIHDLNMLRFLAGSEPRVEAVNLQRRNGRIVMLDFGAFPAVLEMAEIASVDWQEGVEVLFERGRLALYFSSPLLRNVPARVEFTRGGEQPQTIVPHMAWSWSFRRQAEAFVADILAGQEPLAGGHDSLDDMHLAEEIWRQHLDKMTVR